MCVSWWRHQIETFSALLAFVRGIHQPPVNSPHKGQGRGALMFSLICAWIHGWVSNPDAGAWRSHHAHYDVTVIFYTFVNLHYNLWFYIAETRQFNSLRYVIVPICPFPQNAGDASIRIVAVVAHHRLVTFVWTWFIPLHWRHNDHDSVSNHQPHDCLLNRLFRRR